MVYLWKSCLQKLVICDMSKISEMTCPRKKLPEVNALSTSQINNDLTDLKEEDFCGGKVLIANVLSASQSYDRSYFCNKTLDQYLTLYREFSSKNFDYY